MAKRKQQEKKPKSGRVRLHAAAETVQEQEARLWTALQPHAEASVQFWNTFFALRSGKQPLTSAQMQRLIDLLRAICWVETKHGTYDGGACHGLVDVVQCCDTRNPWWQELLHRQPGSDRFVSGPGRKNWWADELPAAAAADAGFDSGAAIGTLVHAENGSADPNFTQRHSLYWAVPLLLQKINTTAGSKTYQCGDVDVPRLLAGAIAYNGGGDPRYGAKVSSALHFFAQESLVLNAAADALEQNPAGHAPKPAVILHPSPNHASRQGKTIQYLILHNTDAPLKSALRELTDPATAKSAHYVVDRTGDIYQLVQDAETAWHAGNKPINQQSIGVEIVATKSARGMSPKQDAALAELARFVVDAYDIPQKNVLPHRRVRIGGTDCPGWVWPTDADLDAWCAANLHEL